MTKVLVGQTALVTGGTAGIGKAIAKRLAEQGAYVAIVGTSAERGKQVVAEIEAIDASAGASFHAVDASNYDDVLRMCKLMIEQRGSVDILVNNAGITRDQLLLKMTEDDWDLVMDTNVKSCFNFCHGLARAFVKARKGRIINIGSVIGLTGNAGQINYSASKAAIIGLTKSLAKELASRNVLVNCIAPGFIETAMTSELTQAQRESIVEKIPLKRIGKPEEIADCVLFLAGPWSTYLTGQVITVDGGMVM